MEQFNFIRSIRDEAIWRLYSSMRATGEYTCLTDICRVIADMPMPLHYISYRMARQMYNNRYYRHINSGRIWPQKKRLYESFIQHCERCRQKSNDERIIIMEALLSPAPCMGLSTSMIRRILVRQGAR